MVDTVEWENLEILRCPHFKNMGPMCVLPLYQVLNLGFPLPKGAVSRIQKLCGFGWDSITFFPR